jgi:phospholipid/cholesterol/gamma-HCH transport system substrate-binding protein
MKKDTGNKMKLGIFVSLGLTLFILGIYFIGNRQQLFSTTFRISGIFKDVNGLQVGNNVRFSGIIVGTIDNVEIISDTAVRVDMVIEEKVRKFIKKDAKAIIGSDGLMGNKIMSITPGSPGQKEIANNDYIRTAVPIGIDDILEQIKKTSENATHITGDFSAIMSNMRAGKGTVGKLFMDTVFADELDQTIVNIKQGAGGFKQNMDKAGNSFLFKGLFHKKKKTEKKK